MVRVIEYVREKVIVHVGNQLRRRGIVSGVQNSSDVYLVLVLVLVLELCVLVDMCTDYRLYCFI